MDICFIQLVCSRFFSDQLFSTRYCPGRYGYISHPQVKLLPLWGLSRSSGKQTTEEIRSATQSMLTCAEQKKKTQVGGTMGFAIRNKVVR